jgi:hypothetical protein
MDTSMAPQWFTTLNSIVTFGSSAVVLLAGTIALTYSVYKLCTGGFRFVKVTKKISKFVDRMDVLIDDFWPEILSGLEKKGFINTGTSAKWTSVQAKILRSQSPIEITESGREIINEIGFDKIYSDNSSKFQKLLKEKLTGISKLTEFDIEQASLKVVAELFDKSDLLIKSAETYTFNHPKMPISQLKALLGIFIRDKIIKDPDMRKNFGVVVNETKPPE